MGITDDRLRFAFRPVLSGGWQRYALRKERWMMNTQSAESNPDTIIQDLLRVRESLVESFEGDLHKLVAGARGRQMRSDKAIWRGKPSSDPMSRIVKAPPHD